ncbi:MAG TPA: AIR carboxylase family protein, partial [Mycobacterium sp.]|nr:AIR carboxylase family protein [Mycobacterium sp.]
MTSAPQPRVGVIMGSDSDWSVMQEAAQAIAEFDVPFEVGVVSAHRTPDRMLDYAKGAAARGIEVIVAGAGGAAHLPGMVA